MERSTREEIFRLHARICRALGDQNRLLILIELRRGARTVGELAEAIGASQPLTSRHLAVLREKGLVRAERDGMFVRYDLTDRRILTAIDLLLDVLTGQLQRGAAQGSAARRLRQVRRAGA